MTAPAMPASPAEGPRECPLCGCEMPLLVDGWSRHPLNGCFLERRALHGPDERAAWNRRVPARASAADVEAVARVIALGVGVGFDDLPEAATYRERKTHPDRTPIDRREARAIARAALAVIGGGVEES